MEEIKLAYRDNDRTPVIYCIREMGRRHYNLDVQVLQIRGADDYEAAIFSGAADIIIERLDYLFGEAGKGRRVAMLCAPVVTNALDLVVPPSVQSIEDLKGKRIAVRASGRPYSITLRLRRMGLENDVERVIVGDDEVGRWGQWKKVVSGDCVATYMDPIYLPNAVAAGLKVLPTPELPVIGHFAQACTAQFALKRHEVLGRYMRSVIHALCLMKFRREETMAVAAGEPMKLMKIQDRAELERQVDAIRAKLQVKPYPTPEAILNTYEISTDEWPAGKALENPLMPWDLYWVKRLDDEGFIDGLIHEMKS